MITTSALLERLRRSRPRSPPGHRGAAWRSRRARPPRPPARPASARWSCGSRPGPAARRGRAARRRCRRTPTSGARGDDHVAHAGGDRGAERRWRPGSCRPPDGGAGPHVLAGVADVLPGARRGHASRSRRRRRRRPPGGSPRRAGGDGGAGGDPDRLVAAPARVATGCRPGTRRRRVSGVPPGPRGARSRPSPRRGRGGRRRRRARPAASTRPWASSMPTSSEPSGAPSPARAREHEPQGSVRSTSRGHLERCPSIFSLLRAGSRAVAAGRRSTPAPAIKDGRCRPDLNGGGGRVPSLTRRSISCWADRDPPKTG